MIGTAMRALGSARETMIRLNDRGIICIQHMVQSTPEQKSFVDFIILVTPLPFYACTDALTLVHAFTYELVSSILI
jgi:hypothetical protein